ncbi:hypothetical protein FHR33_002639 [Nonomuraea dietziae]|uniref:Uncharacterized protein n=1 Tax=Nonomuraea dietziae TaxID=65515 RepID=A0A7W5V116_9ACTN|nr:hypothetical protein [Nonomuraea dietziae]MBB3726779.1 hypothetical protein [Nonomuraea dietziae]
MPWPLPVRYVTIVADVVTQPGHRFDSNVMRTKTAPQCFQKRLKPVSAVSPVASV